MKKSERIYKKIYAILVDDIYTLKQNPDKLLFCMVGVLGKAQFDKLINQLEKEGMLDGIEVEYMYSRLKFIYKQIFKDVYEIKFRCKQG